MASYQATINTAAVLFWIVSAAVLGLRQDGPRLASTWRTLFHVAGGIAGGAVLYKLSLSVLRAFGVLENTYHFQFVGFAALPRRAMQVLWVSFKHFVTPNPFFPTALKLLLLGLALLGAYALAREAHRRRAAAPLAIVAAAACVVGFAIYSTKIQFLVGASPTFYRNRFAAFGMSAFYAALIPLGVMLSSQLVRRWAVWGSVIALWICVVQDVAWQHAQVTQYEYDVRVLNRVIARIESLPGFSYDRTYRLAQSGTLMNIRRDRYYYEGVPSPYHNYSAIPGWAPQNPYLGLEPQFKFRSAINPKNLSRDTSDPHLLKVRQTIEQSQPWPHASSVSLVDDTIVVVLEKKSLANKGSKKKSKTEAHAKQPD